jgi:mono/diheme cytochrome c family protein
MSYATFVLKLGAASLALVAIAGCHTDMWQQKRLYPQQESDFYPDRMAARPLPRGVVAQGHLRENEAFFTGFENGKMVTELPIDVTRELLERGRERFDIYCSPCHGRLGDGNGMIAQRGLTLRRPPASFHSDRLREMPIGHFYDVITNGYGVMFSYASRVEPDDRWAIAAYIRALQISQNAGAAALGPEGLQSLRDRQQEEQRIAQR